VCFASVSQNLSNANLIRAKLAPNLDQFRLAEALAITLIVRSDRISVAALDPKLIVPLSTGRRCITAVVGVIPSVVGSGIIRTHLPPRGRSPLPPDPYRKQAEKASRKRSARERERIFDLFLILAGLVWSGVETARPIIEKLESPATQGPPRDAPLSRLLIASSRQLVVGSPAIDARKRARSPRRLGVN